MVVIFPAGQLAARSWFHVQTVPAPLDRVEAAPYVPSGKIKPWHKMPAEEVAESRR